MNRKQTTKKTTKFQGNIIYKAFNPLSKKFEVVEPESELTPDTMVIPFYWVKNDEIYVTVPGTEVYGYVPQN